APLALLTHGIDRFDSVAWLEGLKEDSHYQVQLWFESDGNGRLDSVGRYIRDATVEHLYTDDAGNAHVRVLPGDYYYWQEADLYSGIHNIQTNPQEFNIDIDADGVMDYFIS
ncbi:MAG: hypothetical protein OXE03_09500, partial [Gammaproteobacteria bacterium]|nr:hypothetical protein [Gammaproteobacteria bacterium]